MKHAAVNTSDQDLQCFVVLVLFSSYNESKYF